MSTADQLKAAAQAAERAAAERAAAERAAQLAEKQAAWEQAEVNVFARIAGFIPDGVTVEWDEEQTSPYSLDGAFVADDYRIPFSIRSPLFSNGEPLDGSLQTGDGLRVIDWPMLAAQLGQAIADEEAAEMRAAARVEEMAAELERRTAERAATLAEYEAERAAAEAERAAAEAERAAAKRAERLARKVAEAEAIAAAQAKHLVNPSGLTYDEISHMATQALDAANDAADRLPEVEQLRSEIGIFERQLKEAQAAATWGTNGANETERKNNAARALANDPEVRRLQAALDEMARHLAEIEPEYKKQAMKSGAWRAVCELYAGWLQSLR